MEQLFRCWVLWLMSGFFATVAAETLTFGVVPQQSAVKLLREWAPLLDAVSQKSGIELHFATAPNIPTFEQRVRDGVYDIAYMNPYHLTVFADDPGYVPLVKAEHKVIKGIMVVRKDATLAQLDELDSQTLAFPAPGSFAATLLTQASLTLKGVRFTSQYVGSHDAVYQAVAAGLYPAGGGIIRTFNLLESPIKDQLRILWTSPGYTPHAIAAHPRLTGEQRQRLTDAFFQLRHQPGIETILAKLGMQGFVPADYADWDDVRALHIQPSGE
ncbi:phosphate/phosphite/phosphonate ABC transporter substrate-binding protein [Oceanobacter antarcticus]|uniref:Phosphate/phosphite/phosphonate ABC transporter substrate-binding protein n=1 Tax=Oceanobacter antarcticus TaxID=3133425 RepID=A0ABW8NFZ3_9GAMM